MLRCRLNLATIRGFSTLSAGALSPVVATTTRIRVAAPVLLFAPPLRRIHIVPAQWAAAATGAEGDATPKRKRAQKPTKKRTAAAVEEEGPRVPVSELVAALEEQKAGDVKTIDVQHRCDWADAFVLVTATSPPHAAALASAVKQVVRARGGQGSTEGAGTDWLIVSAGPTMVHIMTDTLRKEVDLEGLWTLQPKTEAPKEEPATPDEAKAVPRRTRNGRLI